jgi:plastocyanin
MLRRSALAALIASAALALAACSSSGSTPAPTSPAASAPASAAASAAASAPASEAASAAAGGVCATGGSGGTAEQIKNFAFPTGITIKAGDSIAWSNGDTAPHTVTFDDNSCDSGQIAAGTAVTVTYSKAGSYPFHCKVHPTMKGTLTVTG